MDCCQEYRGDRRRGKEDTMNESLAERIAKCVQNLDTQVKLQFELQITT